MTFWEKSQNIKKMSQTDIYLPETGILIDLLFCYNDKKEKF